MTKPQGLYNVAFCYLPFVLEGADDAVWAYGQAKDAFRASPAWQEVNDDIRYLFRYICEKYDAASPNCQCHHFVLDPDALAERGFGKGHPWVPAHLWLRRQHGWSEAAAASQVEIDEVDCYVFGTSVNILALRLHMTAETPDDVAAQLFTLKNVRNANLRPYDATLGTLEAQGRPPRTPRSVTLLDVATSLLDALGGLQPRLFFYANEGRERANVFVHVEAPEDGPEPGSGALDAERALYYLANCYKQDYDYDPARVLPVRSYWATPATLWGCSSEALACLTLPARAGAGRGFLTSIFRRNVLYEYQFLYLLLLHQKYAYYRLLMGIGAGQRRDRAQLERFHRDLEVFKANFVFARVSETQQYQALYDTVARELRLAEMERDVAEPIAALTQLRQEDDERAERESDRRVERAMNMVACLAGISAVCDALDIINNYLGGNLPQAARSALSLVVAVLLVVVTVRAARDLMGRRDG